MSLISVHDEWLSLIEISGPFLAVPVLKEVFPQGLEELDGSKRKRLRLTYEEWREAWETGDAEFLELHAAWIDEVLARGLELDEDGCGDALKRGDQIPASLRVTLPEHGVTLAPDLALVDSSQTDKPLMLIQTYASDVDLEGSFQLDGWSASPAERMVQLCRMTGCRIGLITNGERWMLVDAPVGAVTTFASWYARIWSQEPITLQAFVHLLGIRRFFFDQSEQLPALFDRSLKYQDEVTEALGEQVRRAVEVLIQSLDKADQDRNRELLRDVAPTELYEAGLTVMMRLVFLLSAEERGLLLMGDERYEANYAASTLRMQLRAESEEILERRWDAWSRLLAIFRAVFGGIEHENLRMPALGGSLFDPDRFPFLEGRAKGSSWRADTAKPLPIDNRTVLLLLDAIQQFHGRTLSYRALDVEQIGYVYEGLLERTVKRTSEVTLELDATKSVKKPWVTLGELESARLDGNTQLAALLQDHSGCSASRIRNDLAKDVDDTAADRLLTACQADTELRNRIKPYAHLLRTDPWGYPLVYPKDAFIVTTGSDRRETGAHYTPKSLTEAIVTETLTPVAYVGPAEGKPRDEWVLKSPAELLDLKICDPAMGSGAFLVQACRWLSDRFVEAWSQSEANGQFVTVDGKVSAEVTDDEPLPRDAEARTVIARRLIAERCLYGVDLNPLAVELAKLSIWLVTLAKGRPFGFLDHNLRCGDSLLGIHRLDQLTELSMTPTGKGQQRLFGQNIEKAVHEAIELRQRLREMPIRDIHDVEAMARLDADARSRLEVPERIADAFIGSVFALKSNGSALDNAISSLAIQAGQAIDDHQGAIALIIKRAASALTTDSPVDKSRRKPFHWPLEFPEVFQRDHVGFDAIVGNPPFLGGQRITGVAGTAFRDWLVKYVAEGRRGSADLVAYFFLRAWSLLRSGGGFGLLAVNTIAEGDTRQVGLEAMVRTGAVIHSAYPNEPWPGAAAVVTSRVHVHKGTWQGPKSLLGRSVNYISAFLSDQEDWSPKKLKENEGCAFQGSIVLGMGFVLTPDEAQRMLNADPRNVEVISPYLNGEDLNTDPMQKPRRWAINFWDWPEEKARTYELPYKWIEGKVKPERMRTNESNSTGRRRKQFWWQYGSDAKNLYHAIGRGSQFVKHPGDANAAPKIALDSVIAVTRVSKYLNAALIPNTSIFTLDLFVFALDDFASLALLQSNPFVAWSWSRGGRMKHDLRFSGTDVFETFPMPSAELPYDLKELGEKFHEERSTLMAELNIGLTKVTNLIHSPKIIDLRVGSLRKIWSEIDASVINTFGWNDIDLGHGFHEVDYRPENDRVRFTISEPARIEILHRLSVLNRQRYDEEVVNGLQKSSVSSSKPLKKSAAISRLSSSAAAMQPSFDFDEGSTQSQTIQTSAENGNQWGASAIDQILAWLEAHNGWFTKMAILNGSGATEKSWDPAIAELLKEEYVESRDVGDSTRYRAKP